MARAERFFAELRRRNVLRAGVLYVGAVWALAQGIASLGPALGMPDWGTRWFVIAGVIGFPFWIAFAWFYEWTPEGFKREREIEAGESITHHTGGKLDFIIIGVLALAIVLLLTDRFVLRGGVNVQAAAEISQQSIAVLPFLNMSDDKSNEYFSDGISEELLNLLARIPQLQVTARTSSFSFKGKNVGIREIAQTLHVAHVLEGSVRKAGNSVRITAQLIKADSGTQLWSRSWDRELDDIFAIQDEIAADVVKQLKVTLLGEVPKARTTDPEAYALYLQAVQLASQRTAEAHTQSEALLRQVLEIDPSYALAWVALATNFANQVGTGLLPAAEGLALARDAATRALTIDPELASAHARLGFIAVFGESDLAGGAQHYKRALALDPANLAVLAGSGTMLTTLGRLDEALSVEQFILSRDPVNVTVLSNRGVRLRGTGQFDAAEATLRTVLSLAPGRGSARFQTGVVLLLKGDATAALAEMEQETSEVWKMLGLPMAYHALGRKADSDHALATLILEDGKEGAYNIAYVHAFRGEADQAFEWLDKALEHGDGGLNEIVSENLFANIHSDPRWVPFLRKIGRAPEQLAKIEFKVTLPDASGL